VENLGLIDWPAVGAASLWISGLAVILASLGFVDYRRATTGLKMRAVLGQPAYQLAINGGLALFCLGLLASSRTWWEATIWGLLALAFLAYTILAWRAQRRTRGD
jgi:hypothetical protein